VSERAEGTSRNVTAVHLDAVGGVAGDMFAGALLDIRPDLWPACQRAIAAVGLPDGAMARLTRHSDGMLAGSRFVVDGPAPKPSGGGDSHVNWSDIRERIASAPLDEPTRLAALDIFTVLAEAEAAVHGIDVDRVQFHEVGAYDSIADILAAAAIVSALGPCRWSIGPIPRGRGLVRTAHGMVPVPAPATVELLKGFALTDDGEEGERVTPTGAAILRALAPSQGADPVPRLLIGAGTGFGTRKLRSRSNILRATLYADADTASPSEPVEVMRFEVDDQTAEDLAVALDHLRDVPDVIDVCQWPVLGKKGRQAAAVQVLVSPEAADRIAGEIFNETTTLGVRRQTVSRTTLDRRIRDIQGVPVKLARRPKGMSAKAEMASLAPVKGAGARRARRRMAEAEAMETENADG
jgi:uncharacterized protein (TIGR00299 family) protein